MLFAFFATAPLQHCYAQYGHAKLVVAEKGGQPRTYTFLQFPVASFGCGKIISVGSDNNYTDITFMSGSFKNGNGSDMTIVVSIRIGPSGVGVFSINPPDDKTPWAYMSINFNDLAGPSLDGKDGVDGTKGKITITNYPSIGGNITGTFQGTLYDLSDKKSGFYDVSGSFNIKRTQ